MNTLQFTVEKAKNGLDTISVRGENGSEIFLHSRIHPEKDFSVKIPDDFAGTVIVLGFALGYHIANIPRGKIRRLICADISAEIAALNYSKVSNQFPPDFIILAIPGKEASDPHFWNEYIGTDSQIIIAEHPASVRAFPQYYSSLKNTIGNFISKKASDTATKKRFGYLYFKNALKNLDDFTMSKNILCFEGKFKGFTAAVVSSGPSLARYAAQLLEASPGIFIIAADSALPALVSFGIRPDFIITVDPQAYTWEHLRPAVKSDILIMPLTAHPSVKTDNTFYYMNSHPICQVVSHLHSSASIDSNCGNVTGDALKFADFCSFSKIYIAGLDSSFPFNEIYSRGTAYQKRYLTKTNRINTLEKMNADYIFINSSNFKESGINTRKSFIQYKNGIEKMIGDKFIHLSAHSIPLNGCAHSPDLSADSADVNKTEYLNGIIKSAQRNSISKREIFSLIKNHAVRRELFRESLGGDFPDKESRLTRLMK